MYNYDKYLVTKNDYKKLMYIEKQIGGTIKNETKHYQPINLFLFFDLLQMKNEIISMTNDDDVIILVGHTPSYLKVFIEQERKIFVLPFSGKAYWIINSDGSIDDSFCNVNEISDHDHASLNIDELLQKKLISDEYYYYLKPFENVFKDMPKEEHHLIENYTWASFMPTKEGETTYFNYLNNETFMTKKFMKKNWNNIVLVDYSSGRTIQGVSIFFNRYVENIPNNFEKDLCTINGAKPLKFINIGMRHKRKINISEKIYHEYNLRQKYFNLNRHLILFLGSIKFLNLDKFIIEELFPRYVPDYSTFQWKNKPYNNIKKYNKDFKDGIKELRKLKNIYDLYKKYDNDESIALELYDIVKNMDYVPKEFNDNVINRSNVIEKLKKLFASFSDAILLSKYDEY